jgi:hypothetical protein
VWLTVHSLPLPLSMSNIAGSGVIIGNFEFCEVVKDDNEFAFRNRLG